MKQYIGFVRDHSMSMTHLKNAAMKDYNALISSFKSAAKHSSIDTVVSTVKCGIGPGMGRVERDVVNSSVEALLPLEYYETNGGSTPLFDSVGELINIFKEVPDYHNKDVSFLVMVVTDGGENSSGGWKHRFEHELKELQRTDRWTFTFRVPCGYKRTLINYGVPEYNIQEWEQNEQAMERSTGHTISAVQDYYSLRASGQTATKSFYTTNLAGATNADGGKTSVRAALHSIAKEASVYPNVVREGASIKDVSMHYTGQYKKGTCFYQLRRRESAVQDHKIICVQEKQTRNIYSGRAARDLLGLPHHGTVAVAPGNHGNYDIFIQSTSTTRKIPLNSNVLVWMNVRNM